MPDGFHWVNFLEAFAAAVTIFAVLGGIVVAIYFGRKATVSVAGEFHEYAGLVSIAARSSVTAIGYFAFRFADPGTMLSVTELVWPPGADLPRENVDQPWEVTEVFGAQFAYGGETLETTTVISIGAPAENAIGWLVRLDATRRTKLGRFAVWTGNDWLKRKLVRSWKDRAFVARPEVASAP